MYRVIISDAAMNDVAHLPRNYQRLVLEKLTDLSQNPRPRGVKKLQTYELVYRVRQGPYRILYKINDIQFEITIVRIKLRKEAYR
jgi:mRNA interferase RelE/StbE